MNETVNLMLKHSSVRKFSDKEIDREVVNTIVKCAQMASTSSHFQAYTIIEVADKDKLAALKEASGGQASFDTAKLVLLFCGDLNRASKYFKDIDQEVLSNTESYTVATVDAALAAQNAILSAESLGLGGVVVGGIRNEVEKLYEEFKIPNMAFPLFAICLGYPEKKPGVKPRLPQDLVHKKEFYDTSKDEELMAEYNREVSEYYEERTKGKVKDTWGEHCGELLMSKTRDHVGGDFRKHGLLKK